MVALSALERLQLELAEARQALVEAEQQRQQERQRADEAEQQQQQAEQERQQERQRAEQAEQRQQQAEQERQYERQRNQPTTLDEFLEACHLHISKPLAVQTDRSLNTGGGITKPNNRYYP
jgi:hypothetical protein